MHRITDVRDIRLDDLVISKGQVRVRDAGKEIDELADSIRKIGLLEPIVVTTAEAPGKYEILTGQRRFLAHKTLGLETISAAVIDGHVDETEAKVISLTENLVRRDLNSRDLIDACTALFHKYGSIKAVAEETGLPYGDVSKYVKYDQLIPELKELVDTGVAQLPAALRAQQAASVTGTLNKQDAVQLAQELSGMSGAQQGQIVKDRLDNPTKPVDEVIESAKTGGKVTQIIVTLGGEAHNRLRHFADEEKTSMDDAARSLIEEALATKGFTGD